jgi:hypothetical protein
MGCMMRKCLFLIVILGSHCCFAQTYDQEVIKAGEANSKRQYDSCAIFFNRAFLLKPPSGNDMYNAAICNAKSGNTEKSFLLLITAVEKGINISKLKIDPDLESLHDQTKWKKLIKKANHIQLDSFNTCRYPEYAKQLAKIWETDQYYRFRLGQAYESGADTSIINDLWKEMRKADSLNDNVSKLEAIMNKIGWPAISKVGKLGANTAFLVIDHSSRETMEKLFPFLEEAAKKGEASLSSYATMKDRILVNRGKKQVYGTQSYRDEKGKAILFPVEDEKNLNNLRKEVGLEPLPEFANY